MELNRENLILALPMLVVFAGLEALYLVLVRKQIYNWRESLASIGVALGEQIIRLTASTMVAAFAYGVWQYRLLTLSMQHALYWPLLFILVEFSYYWFHRFSHTCRWLWATHAVHHSPRHFYLSGAYRLGWTGPLTGGFLFFTPLFLLGFNPASVVAVIGLNLLYQYWLHTELIGRLGWFDRVFNSPANHRVHHAADAIYLDKNFGGVLMVFDHLFGTYQSEDKNNPVSRYGLIPTVGSYNPVKIAFHEWAGIADELKAKPGVKARLWILFGKP